jgi:hypothetical protein
MELELRTDVPELVKAATLSKERISLPKEDISGGPNGVFLNSPQRHVDTNQTTVFANVLGIHLPETQNRTLPAIVLLLMFPPCRGNVLMTLASDNAQ